MRQLPFVLLLLGSLLFTFACDNAVEEAKEDNEEKFEDTQLEEEAEFAAEMANYFLLTDAMTQLAMDRIQDDRVKQFATEMQADHQKMYSELKQLAAQANISLPSENSEEDLEDFADEVEDDEEAADVSVAYLERIIDLHESFGKMAENRIADTEFKEFLEFSRRVSSHQFVHLNQAKELLNSLSGNSDS